MGMTADKLLLLINLTSDAVLCQNVVLLTHVIRLNKSLCVPLQICNYIVL